MDGNLFWGIALTAAVVGACGAWFYFCGYTERTRQTRRLARHTLLYAGIGFILGLALVTSDMGSAPMGIVAFTACCGLLVYAAGWAMIAADDHSLVLVNLTGRALLLADPTLAPFFTLPAPRPEPATVLPPQVPRTCYIVSSELGREGAEAQRGDLYTVDLESATDYRESGLLVRRLLPVLREGAADPPPPRESQPL